MYATGYGDYASSDASAMLASAGVFYIIALAIAILMLVCWVKIFKKFGMKGWYALCPMLDSYMIYKHVWGDGWVFLLSWIPFYNIYLAIKTEIGLAKSFGKSTAFGWGLILLGIIFLPILAFGDSEYIENPYTM